MSTKIHADFFVLLKQLPEATKEDLVFAYSKGTTESLSTFYDTDRAGYNLMLQELHKRVQMEIDRKTKQLRSGILTRLQRYGVDTTDWDCVNRFLEQPKIAGKRLYSMTQDEMIQLTKKLEIILSKHQNKQNKALEIAQSN